MHCKKTKKNFKLNFVNLSKIKNSSLIFFANQAKEGNQKLFSS